MELHPILEVESKKQLLTVAELAIQDKFQALRVMISCKMVKVRTIYESSPLRLQQDDNLIVM